MTLDQRTVLEIALASGVKLEHGCRAGVCGRCKAILLDGEVTTLCDFALAAEEKGDRDNSDLSVCADVGYRGGLLSGRPAWAETTSPEPAGDAANAVLAAAGHNFRRLLGAA